MLSCCCKTAKRESVKSLLTIAKQQKHCWFTWGKVALRDYTEVAKTLHDLECYTRNQGLWDVHALVFEAVEELYLARDLAFRLEDNSIPDGRIRNMLLDRLGRSPGRIISDDLRP